MSGAGRLDDDLVDVHRGLKKGFETGGRPGLGAEDLVHLCSFLPQSGILEALGSGEPWVGCREQGARDGKYNSTFVYAVNTLKTFKNKGILYVAGYRTHISTSILRVSGASPPLFEGDFRAKNTPLHKYLFLFSTVGK